MQLGWVDFSKEDRAKVLDVMNLLKKEEAVDEIGIGRVRDAFANIFFPGTSTVQTSAKYFLIVPYVLKEATQGSYGNDVAKIIDRINREEKKCGILLKENCPDADGIIGRRVLPEGWVIRKPSGIYWSGIRTYGICTRDLSITELVRLSVAMRQEQADKVALGNRGDEKTGLSADDADAALGASTQLFSVPDDYYGDWREGLNINLTPSEAQFLKEKIEKSVPDSLLAHLLKNNIDVSKYDSFAAIYEDLRDSLPKNLSEAAWLACEFNKLVYVAHVRYNYILSNGNNADAVDRWQAIEADIHNMISVDSDEVLAYLGIYDPYLRRFLNGFKNALAEGRLNEADDILIKREIEIKRKNRAKLCNRENYKATDWFGGYYLDYRLQSAKRLILDIYRGEEGANV